MLTVTPVANNSNVYQVSLSGLQISGVQHSDLTITQATTGQSVGVLCASLVQWAGLTENFLRQALASRAPN